MEVRDDRVDVSFVLPGLVQAGGVRAVLEMADRLRGRGRSTAVVIPRRAVLSSRRSPVGVAQRFLPVDLQPLVQRVAERKPQSQSWFPLRTPVVSADVPLWRDIPDSRAVVATSWRIAEEVLRMPSAGERAVYFLQHHETWSGPTARVDATWEAFDRMIVSSEWLRSMAIERFGKSSVGLAVYGVDLETFSPGERAAGESQTATGVPVVGFMHDPREWKGGADMLEALARVRASREIRVRGFGLGGSDTLPPWVEFAGRITGEALADFYRSLDVFASASWSETGPMTLPEAMACGVAVVSTDVGNARLWSDEGRGIRLVPPRDVTALGGALSELLEDDVMRKAMAERGRGIIQDFTWDRTARDFDDALVGFGLLEPIGATA